MPILEQAQRALCTAHVCEYQEGLPSLDENVCSSLKSSGMDAGATQWKCCRTTSTAFSLTSPSTEQGHARQSESHCLLLRRRHEKMATLTGSIGVATNSFSSASKRLDNVRAMGHCTDVHAWAASARSSVAERVSATATAVAFDEDDSTRG